MKCQAFTTTDELVRFVTDNSITQAKIVEIFWKEGQWYLFYFV